MNPSACPLPNFHIIILVVVHMSYPNKSLHIGPLERFIRSCPDRYFVTLTTKRCLDDIQLSTEVSKTLHRVNTTLFGTHYTRKKTVRLACLAVQERSFKHGLHTHLLIGVPENSLTLKANPSKLSAPDLILQTWVSLDDHGYRALRAQDARDIYDFAGVSRYVHKTIGAPADLIHIDYINSTYPDVP